MREQINMEDIIYRSKKDIIEPTINSSNEDRFYTSIGEQEFIDEDGYSRVSEQASNIYAKSLNNNNKETKYYVKSNRYGKLYNPTGMTTEGQHKRFNKMIGANEFNFKRVNQRIFELYINFLKTKNTAWLNNAERELV